MTDLNEKVLGGVAALLAVLVVGTVFGRLHGSSGSDTKLEPIGDRVACGLLALPLISLSVYLAFPCAHLAWVLSAPLPLAIYVLLLAGTDESIKWKVLKILRKNFTAALVLAVMAIYLAMAVFAWLSQTERFH